MVLINYVILDLKNTGGGTIPISIGAGGEASTTSNLTGHAISNNGKSGNETTITTANDSIDAVGGASGLVARANEFHFAPPGKGSRSGASLVDINDEGLQVSFDSIKRGEGSRGSLGGENGSSPCYASAGQQGFVWIYF